MKLAGALPWSMVEWVWILHMLLVNQLAIHCTCTCTHVCYLNTACTPPQVDISGAFAYVSAPKDATELGLIKKACQITCTVFSKHVKKEIVTIVDVEKKVKHSKLAEEIEQAIVDGKYSPPGSADGVVSQVLNYGWFLGHSCWHLEGRGT